MLEGAEAPAPKRKKPIFVSSLIFISEILSKYIDFLNK